MGQNSVCITAINTALDIPQDRVRYSCDCPSKTHKAKVIKHHPK